MSLQLSIACNDVRRSFILSAAEMDILGRLVQTVGANAGAVFNVSEFGVPKRVPTTDIRHTIESLALACEQGNKEWPYTYAVQYAFPGTTETFTSSGMLSGLRIGGSVDVFTIQCGFGFCRLERMQIMSDGRGKLVSTEDIRHLKAVSTDNMGEVRIKKRKRPFHLPEILKDIREFLEGLPPTSEADVTLG